METNTTIPQDLGALLGFKVSSVLDASSRRKKISSKRQSRASEPDEPTTTSKQEIIRQVKMDATTC